MQYITSCNLLCRLQLSRAPSGARGSPCAGEDLYIFSLFRIVDLDTSQEPVFLNLWGEILTTFPSFQTTKGKPAFLFSFTTPLTASLRAFSAMAGRDCFKCLFVIHSQPTTLFLCNQMRFNVGVIK